MAVKTGGGWEEPQSCAGADTGDRAQGQTATRMRYMPEWLRFVAVYILVVLVLIGVERTSFALTRLPVRLTLGPETGTLELDGSSMFISWANTNVSTGQASVAPSAAVFIRNSPLQREFQIDGTDSTNNFTQDDTYLQRIADSPYYRFQAWMRSNETYSSWRDITAYDLAAHQRLQPIVADGGTRLAFPAQTPVEITASLERPETVAQILFLCADIPCAEALLDRNERVVVFHTLLADGSIGEERKTFFPNQQLPFLAEVVDDLARTALWSLALLGLLAGLQATAMLLVTLARQSGSLALRRSQTQARPDPATLWSNVTAQAKRACEWSGSFSISVGTRRITLRPCSSALAAGVTIGASFALTLYIGLVQYHGYPHILDASAYFFQAKIFASGKLAASAPDDLAAFQGPFMIASQGRWFAQYAPMTSLLLAVGLVLRVPWLIEPLLGAAALWGIYRIGCLLFSPFESWLAVFLAALSPFYLFLAPSYLSHIPALFFAVYFLLALLCFGRWQRSRDLLVAAASLGGLLLTRELSAVIFGMVAIPYVAFVNRAALRRHIVELLPAILAASAIFFVAVFAYLLYNWLQTGDAFTMPRTLFSPSDRYGFGDGIGFYGRHTLAAGLVNLDQLVTVLLIDLYGWPFYLTLAFVPCAFLRLFHHRTRGQTTTSLLQWDTFCLILLCALAAAQVGYFYHGIFLGPRYLYEALPFLLLLTARGITALVATLTGLADSLTRRSSAVRSYPAHIAVSRGLVGLALLVLLACNLVYFMPRQFELHANFTGLPIYMPIDTQAVYAFHPDSAVIVTGDWSVYSYVLWPLNDPDLRAPTIYAYAPTPDALARVRAIYSTRTFYTMSIAPDGHVVFRRLAG